MTNLKGLVDEFGAVLVSLLSWELCLFEFQELTPEDLEGDKLHLLEKKRFNLGFVINNDLRDIIGALCIEDANRLTRRQLLDASIRCSLT